MRRAGGSRAGANAAPCSRQRPAQRCAPPAQGANQAAAAARLGYPTYFLGQVRVTVCCRGEGGGGGGGGRLGFSPPPPPPPPGCSTLQTGDDANAATLRAALDGCGVKLDHLTATPGPSGTAIILLQPSGGGGRGAPRAWPRTRGVWAQRTHRAGARRRPAPWRVQHQAGCPGPCAGHAARACRREQHHHRGRRQPGCLAPGGSCPAAAGQRGRGAAAARNPGGRQPASGQGARAMPRSARGMRSLGQAAHLLPLLQDSH